MNGTINNNLERGKKLHFIEFRNDNGHYQAQCLFFT